MFRGLEDKVPVKESLDHDCGGERRVERRSRNREVRQLGRRDRGGAVAGMCGIPAPEPALVNTGGCDQ